MLDEDLCSHRLAFPLVIVSGIGIVYYLKGECLGIVLVVGR